MARNEVKLKVVLTDDGTLKLVTDKAKKAKKATDDLTGSTENLNRARNRYNKAEKGVAGLGANTTKNFSKMNQTLGSGSSGLVAAYATLAANAFAATAALNALSRAAAFEQLANGLALIGSQAGQNLPQVANQLKDITEGALSTEQALRATAVATTSGFSSDQLLKLTKVAKGASVALGRDLGDALDRLVRGTAKLEPEILDELGIIVRLDDATEKYASSVGKVAGDLTTFERQQAFLNATIEQGEKKYGALAERLDTNPYEKLAAAFNDLSKSIITGVNTVLGPFAEFLSQNSFALFGALTAFTFSITRALLPSLTSMSVAASEIHTRAAATAKKAGRVISSQYQRQLAEVTRLARAARGLNALPASFQRSLPALEAGTLKAKELKTLLNNLKKAEQLRGAAIARAGAQASKAKIDEFNAVKALRMEVEALTASETKRSVANTSGAAAGGRSRTSRRTSNAISLIENAGAFEGLGIATRNAGNELRGFNRTARRNVQQLGVLRGSLVSARLAFVSATGAAKVFGAALLNAIPVLGQVLFVLSLIGPYLADLIGFGETDPVTEATEGFKSFSQVSVELSRSLALATSEGEKNFATMKAGAGIINQVVSAYEALKQSKIEKAYEGFDEALNDQVSKIKLIGKQEEELAETREKIAAKEAEARAKGVDPSQLGFYQYLKDQEESRLNRLQKTRVELEGLRESVAKGLGDAAVITQAEGIDLLSKAVANLRAAPDGTENFAGELELFEQALINIQKPGADAADIIKELRDTATGKLAITKAAEDAQSQMSQFNGEIAKLGKKAPTEFQAATDYLSGVSKALKTLNNDQEQYKDFMADAANENIVKIIERAGTESLEEVVALLEQNNEKIAQSVIIAKEYEATAKRIGQAASANTLLTEKQVEFERRAVQARITGLEATRENLTISGGEVKNKERIAQIDKELSQLRNDLVDEAEKNFRVEQASIKAAQLRLKLNEKRLQSEERLFQMRQRLQKLDLEIARAKAGSGLTPIDEYKLAKNSAEEQKTIEDKKFELSSRRLVLEFRLLDSQMLLEQKRMQRLAAEIRAEGEAQKKQGMVGAIAYVTANKEAAELEKGIMSLEAVRQEAGEATVAQLVASYKALGLTKEEIDKRVALLAIKAEQYRFQLRMQQIEAEAQLTAARGAEVTATFFMQYKVNEELNQLLIERQSLADKGEDTAEKDLQITQKKTEQLKLQLDLIEKQTERSKSIVSTSPVAVAAAQTAGSIQQGQANIQDALDARKKATEARDTFKNEYALELALGVEAATNKLADLETAAASAGQGVNETYGAAMRKVGQEVKGLISQIASDMAALGPEGQIFAPALESLGVFTQSLINLGSQLTETLGTIGEDMSVSFENIGASFEALDPKEKMETMGAVFAAAAAGFGAIGALLQAKSQQAVAGIDKEIEAEKKRDGKSKESVAKIKQLEARKEAIKKKAFEKDKKMKMAQTVMSTAAAIMQTLAQGGYFMIPLAVMIGAMGAAQLAIISSMSYQGGGAVSTPSAPSQISMGDRKNSVDLAKSQSARGELGYFRGESGVGGPENFKATGAFSGLKYRANGGNTAFMVGERGPELFMPERPGTIVPNDDVSPAAPTNVSFNISTVDATGVEDLLIRQQGNIIGMIREAANSYGQDFVEEVDTSVFNSTTGGVSRY